MAAPEQRAPGDAVLVFDGIFLHRPELRGYWDYSVFLRVGFGISVPRCARRDGAAFDPDACDPRAGTNRRYVHGQLRYLAECRPEGRATLVVDNEDLAAPFIVAAARSRP